MDNLGMILWKTSGHRSSATIFWHQIPLCTSTRPSPLLMMPEKRTMKYRGTMGRVVKCTRHQARGMVMTQE